jgi:argonaute-like protein implicated in RNA metabolism and viral defense
LGSESIEHRLIKNTICQKLKEWTGAALQEFPSSGYLDTYPGLRVPTPIEIVEHHGDTPIKTICEEIFALTKMNWNSADFCIRRPITLEYASEVGKILAYVPEEVIPRPEYRFYM